MNFPLILKWTITDKCNFNCKHCYKNHRTKEMSKKDIDLIINELKNNKIACIALTGGEPLLSKHFPYIVRKPKESNIVTEVATNGYFITKDIINLFKENGIKKIQISLEGPNAKINDFIRGKGTFDVVVNNIKRLVSENIKVVIANTLNHYNCIFLDEMVELANCLKVFALRFEIYIPVRDDKYKLNLTLNDLKYIRKNFVRYKEYKNIILPIFHDKNNCGAGKYMAMLNSDNTISPCDLLSDKVRSSKSINSKCSFKNIWLNDIILKEWRNNNYIGCFLIDNIDK